MSLTRKMNEETIKDIRNSINDLSKTLDIACEPSRQITAEIIEYYKRRIEIENDYGMRLIRLGEKLGEKIQKIMPLVQFKDNMPDTRYELYNLLNVIEAEVKEKGLSTIKYSETISNNIIPAMNKYTEFHTLKLNKSKKLLSTLSESLIQGINTIYDKSHIYYKNVLNEQKTSAKFNTCIKKKNIKPVKNADIVEQKLVKWEKAYKEDIIRTDRSRNQYILANDSSKKCQDNFYTQQISQIISTTNWKFGEFWTYFLTTYVKALQDLNDVSTTNSKKYDKLGFSDDLETEVFLDRYKNKFHEKSLKLPLIISQSDRTTKIVCDGPLKIELENDIHITEENINKTEDELKTIKKSTSDKKAIQIQWYKENLSSDLLKESKSYTFGSKKQSQNEGFDSNEYFQILENCMNLEMSLYYGKTRLNLIKAALEKTIDSQTSLSTKNHNNKKMVEFEDDIVQHCNTYNVKIPTVITLCAKYLCSNDLLKTVGIFRVSPAISDVKEIIEFISENGYIKEGSNAAPIATIMKQYLRNMKNFINIKDLPKLLSEIAFTTKNKYLEETRKLMEELSVQSRDLLIFIAKFLRHIANMSDVNKMNLQNLSIVFGQTLFAQDNSGETKFDYQTDVNTFLKLFCERIFEIFPDESTLLEFEETQKVDSEENTFLEILDDGPNFDGSITIIGNNQSRESPSDKDSIDYVKNASKDTSLTDLPPPDDLSPSNEILTKDELISAIETCKTSSMDENNN